MSKLANLAQGWDKVEEAGTFESIPVGVYKLAIVEATDFPENDYIEFLVDIAEGPFRGFFTKLNKNSTGWSPAATFRKYYSDKALPFFKGFITAVEKSNSNYNFKASQGNVTALKNKYIVGIFEKQQVPVVDENGQPKVYVQLNDRFRSIEALNEGKIEAPSEDDIKLLNAWGLEKFAEAKKEWEREKGIQAPQDTYHAAADAIISDDDLPF